MRSGRATLLAAVATCLAGVPAAALAIGGCGTDSQTSGRQSGEQPIGHTSVAKRPNIVVLMTDDQDLASMPAMPRTMRLSRSGTTFTNFVVTTPTCCPSRASFQTGQYGHNHGVLANVPGYPTLRDKDNVLPAWLQRAGYRTAEFGKFMNGYPSPENENGAVPAPGWDRWEALLPPYSYFEYPLSISGEVRHFGKRDSDYLDQVLSRRAVRFINANPSARRPFFMWLNLYAPHIDPVGEARAGRCAGSAIPAPRDRNRVKAGEVPEPESFNEGNVSDKPFFIRERDPVDAEKAGKWRRYAACRLASLAEADRAVARVHAALRDAGELDSTLLVFTSDNGWLHGEHRIEGKGVPYEEAIRVPLIVWAPSQLLDGSPPPPKVDEPVANIDLAPTALDAASQRPCVSRGDCRLMDGRSLLPLLRGDPHAWPEERPILLESREGDYGICKFQGVWTARHVYVEHSPFRSGDSGPCAPVSDRELYDLGDDPAQLENLYPPARGSAQFRVLTALKARLKELRRCRGNERGDKGSGKRHPCA